MDPEKAKQLADEAAQIAKKMAEALKQYDKEMAMLLYAKQWSDTKMNTTFPEGTEHKKTNNKEAAQKLEKMMEDAKLKWKYVTENDKKKVLEMEKIVLEGQEQIKALYKPA